MIFKIYFTLIIMYIAGWIQADTSYNWKGCFAWVIFYSALYWSFISIFFIYEKIKMWRVYQKHNKLFGELKKMQNEEDKFQKCPRCGIVYAHECIDENGEPGVYWPKYNQGLNK